MLGRFVSLGRIFHGALVALLLVCCTSVDGLTSNSSGDDGGTGACGGDLSSDPKNCGACGKACSYANAEATCSNGVCQLGVCAQGFRDCNGGPENGCETHVLGGDPEHCGSCTERCSFPHAKAACAQGGVCKMDVCETDWADCSNGASDGCETQIIGDDAKNCGGCGKACLLGQSCHSGKCSEDEVTCSSPGITCTQPSCFITGRFSVTPNVVVDRKNGRRLWQRAHQGAGAHIDSARLFCEALKLDGVTSGWRLPTYPELAELLYQAGNIQGCPTCAPATDQAAFPNVPIDPTMWTETKGSPGTYETTNFCDGRMNYESGPTEDHVFRCTHDPI